MAEPAEGPWFIDPRPTDDGLCRIDDGRQDGMYPILCEWSEAPLVVQAWTIPALREALENGIEIIAADTKNDGDMTGVENWVNALEKWIVQARAALSLLNTNETEKTDG